MMKLLIAWPLIALSALSASRAEEIVFPRVKDPLRLEIDQSSFAIRASDRDGDALERELEQLGLGEFRSAERLLDDLWLFARPTASDAATPRAMSEVIEIVGSARIGFATPTAHSADGGTSWVRDLVSIRFREGVDPRWVERELSESATIVERVFAGLEPTSR